MPEDTGVHRSRWRQVWRWLGAPWQRGPLELSRQIMRRAALLVLATLVSLLLAGVWRMQDDVEEELQAAHRLAELTALLSVIHLMDDQEALTRLTAWLAQGELRHLTLSVDDENGRRMLESVSPGRSHHDAVTVWGLPWLQYGFASEPEGVSAPMAWHIPRPGRQWWTVTLRSDPDSERHESLHNLQLMMVLSLIGSLVLLAMLASNTRRALAPLAQVLAAIRRLGRGQRHALRDLPVMPNAELESLCEALRRLDQQLGAAEAARRHMAHQVITLQEDERQHLAAELHDELGQHLTAFRVDLAWLMQMPHHPPEVGTVLQGMDHQLGHVHEVVRSLLRRLRPLHTGSAELEDQLLQPLRTLVAAWDRTPGLATRFSLHLQATGADGTPRPWADCHPGRLPDDLALVLYRISQEALTNAARHARASQVSLLLHWQPSPAHPGGGTLDWQVRDNGVGLAEPEQALRRGNGLSGIQARVWSHGADLRCGPPPPPSAPVGLCLSARFVLGTPPPGAGPEPGADPEPSDRP